MLNMKYIAILSLIVLFGAWHLFIIIRPDTVDLDLGLLVIFVEIIAASLIALLIGFLSKSTSQNYIFLSILIGSLYFPALVPKLDQFRTWVVREPAVLFGWIVFILGANLLARILKRIYEKLKKYAKN